MSGIGIRALDLPAPQCAGPLADVLTDCVDGGASVSFMAGLTHAEAEAFWADELAAGDGRTILVAEDAQGICGVVQVVPAWAPNQPHRADIAKLLVHRRARRRGVAEALMRAAEAAAVAMGRPLLVLDTVTGSPADRLYRRLGWTEIGVAPDYALFPDGSFCDATFFYKRAG